VAKGTKQQERDRRAKIEEMRRAEQARQRRRSILFIVIAAVVGVGLVAAAAIPAYIDSRNDPANKPLSDFGVAAGAADCDDVVVDEGTNNDQDRAHVETGTTQAYETVPPSHGPHWDTPIFPAREFYTSADAPRMEQLVHNLEHGYTIVWYDNEIPVKQLDVLRNIATSAREKDPTRGKFIVSKWDNGYGDFPDDMNVALVHWGAQDSYRQMCGQVSGEVIEQFVEDHPASNAPEPNAA
jgi:hypothetical protein